MQNDALRERLIDASTTTNPEIAQIISFKDTKISNYKPPFSFHRYEIYVVEEWTSHGFMPWFLALAPDRPVIEFRQWYNFEDILKADGSIISTSEKALQYVTSAFDLLKPDRRETYYLLSHASDLPVLREEQKAEIVARFESVISPPRAQAFPTHYAITFYAATNQTLKHYTVRVSPIGQMQESYEVIAENLPLPVTLPH